MPFENMCIMKFYEDALTNKRSFAVFTRILWFLLHHMVKLHVFIRDISSSLRKMSLHFITLYLVGCALRWIK